MNLKQFDPIKILNHWETLNAVFEGQNPPPITCGFDPSSLCNHDCVWCTYRDVKERKSTMMSAEIMFHLIQELGKGGVKAITFTGGGEPLMNPATIEGMYRAQKAGLEIGLITNGGLMQNACRAVVDTCTFLRISLDAATHKTHTLLHKPKNLSRDNFNKILENIETVINLRKKIDKNLTVGISFLVHSYNYLEIYEATALAKKLGVDYIQIRPALPWTGESLRKAQPQFWLVIRESIKKSLELENDKFHVFSILHKFTKRTYAHCLAHNLISIIGADCNVYLCCQFRGDSRFSFGNFREKSFFEIWGSKERQKVIRHINLEKCPPCRYNEYNELLDYLSNKERFHKNFL